jgi:hypothetical protein
MAFALLQPAGREAGSASSFHIRRRRHPVSRVFPGRWPGGWSRRRRCLCSAGLRDSDLRRRDSFALEIKISHFNIFRGFVRIPGVELGDPVATGNSGLPPRPRRSNSGDEFWHRPRGAQIDLRIFARTLAAAGRKIVGPHAIRARRREIRCLLLRGIPRHSRLGRVSSSGKERSRLNPEGSLFSEGAEGGGVVEFCCAHAEPTTPSSKKIHHPTSHASILPFRALACGNSPIPGSPGKVLLPAIQDTFPTTTFNTATSQANF